MAEKTEELFKDSKGENIQQQSPLDETYLPITSRPQNVAAGMQSVGLNERSEEIEGRFQESLKTISEETSQLVQSLVEERELIRELCGLLAQTLKSLRISFSIPVECLTSLGVETKQVRLDKNAHLTVVWNDGKVWSRPLEEYHPAIILRVLLVVTPELERMIADCRRSVGRRISILEKVKRELKSVQEVFASFDRGGQRRP